MLGALWGLLFPAGAMPWLAAGGVAAWQAALLALVAGRTLLLVAAALASLALSAAASAQHEDWQRRHAPIRAIAPAPDAPPGSAEPVIVEGVLVEDASSGPEGTVVRLRASRVRWGPATIDLTGGLALSIAGTPDPARAREWTRGRRIRAPALLRRPGRYLNDGLADGERASLRRGIALVGTIKSASLVEVVAPASRWQEILARARRRVRGAITDAAGEDPEAAAVVTAILIGDRAGLSNDIERRMQRAGTYHVIAISGGNVALFAALAWAASRLVLRSRRLALGGAMIIVAAYGALVGTGASVGRAVAAAELFLLAMLLDHRAPPLNVVAVVGGMFLLWDPLALTDLGFLLSFGATAGILLVTPAWLARARPGLELLQMRPAILRAALAGTGLLAASAAAEIALLPVQAAAFHRVTLAGLVLNFIAIPAMALAQIGGMIAVAADLAGVDRMRDLSGFFAAMGARALIDSAALVDLVPRLTWRVASPPAWLQALYAIGCAGAIWVSLPRMRRAMAAAAALCGIAIATSPAFAGSSGGRLRVTIFDVGQAEAIAVRLPGGRSLLVDAAGPSDRFDIGDRVLVPALLARGVRALDLLVLTHPDADHIGGAPAVLRDLAPSRVIEGIAPPLHRERNLIAQAVSAGGSMEMLTAGSAVLIDGVLLRVLHPPPPAWERQRVRNDDSLVIEVVFGAVSIVLTADASDAVEGEIAGALAPAKIRVLKAGHHGSRSSTSAAFLDAISPAAALISAGRGNFYGHPSPAVLERLARAGVETFRTDRDGEIDLVTDGRVVTITTFTGRRWAIAAR